jgi:hypothetical protein
VVVLISLPPERDEAPSRISVARCGAEEIVAPFLALYACLDFSSPLAELGVSVLQIRRRRKALREFRALSIALWNLALHKSFPQDRAAFFAVFCETAPCLAGKDRECLRLRERVKAYESLLAEKKDADFLPAAAYLTETLAPKAAHPSRLRLKLSLIIRDLYTRIFDKLV